MTDAEILTGIYNNCDPIKPAEVPFYEDCTVVRGGDAFARDLCRELEQSQTYVYQLFAGHVGGGKSSELRDLATRMNVAVPHGAQKRFLPVIVNVLDYVEENNGAVEFVLLAVVEDLAKVLRQPPFSQPAPNPFPSFIEGLRGLATTPIQMKEVAVTAGPVELSFTNLRNSPTARETVLNTIKGRETRLRDAVNEYIDSVRNVVTNHRHADNTRSYDDFVLILDGMDKIFKVVNREKGLDSYKALFIDGFDDLTSLEASTVFTAPLSLIHVEGNALANLYSRDPYVLPMVKTEIRPENDGDGGIVHAPYEAGRDALIRLLQKRMPPGVALGNVIAEDALRELLYYSGGHIRSLLRFMREAALQTNDTLPISLRSARKAIAGNVGVISRTVNRDDYDMLAQLECGDCEDWNRRSVRHAELLEQACVYEYVNGGDEDFLNSAEPWYAVNPIIRGLDSFRRAVERAKAKE